MMNNEKIKNYKVYRVIALLFMVILLDCMPSIVQFKNELSYGTQRDTIIEILQIIPIIVIASFFIFNPLKKRIKVFTFIFVISYLLLACNSMLICILCIAEIVLLLLKKNDKIVMSVVLSLMLITPLGNISLFFIYPNVFIVDYFTTTLPNWNTYIALLGYLAFLILLLCYLIMYIKNVPLKSKVKKTNIPTETIEPVLSIEDRLINLDLRLQCGEITKAEYDCLRKEIIDKI